MNIREQVTDWSLRVQQNEASLAALVTHIGDFSAATWREHTSQAVVGEVAPLLERIEKLEHRHESRDHASTESDSVRSDPKSVPKAPTSGPTTYQESTTAGIKISGSVRAGTQLEALSDVGFPMQDALWGPPTLTNKGLEKFLKNIDFRDATHLKALDCMDGQATSRDCVMFCDCQASTVLEVDYVLRTGPTVTYIRCDDLDTEKRRTKKLRKRGLEALRIRELSISAPDSSDDRRRFKEWKIQTKPPKYVYDIGQLFIRRRGRDRYDRGRYELIGTNFNMVIDVTKSRKPVWLLMCPEHEMVELKKAKGSRHPFPSRSFGLNGVAIAKIADAIEDISLCSGPFDKTTFMKYMAADQLVANTYFQGKVTLNFCTPDIDDLEARIMCGWKGVQSSGFNTSS